MCEEEGFGPHAAGDDEEDDAGRTRSSKRWSAAVEDPDGHSDSVGGEVCISAGGERHGDVLGRKEGHGRHDCRRRTRTWSGMLMVWLSWTAVVLLWLPYAAASPALGEDLVGRSSAVRSLRRKREYITDSEQRYLMNFGYLPQSDFETGNLRSEEQLHEAIANLQKFAGLKPTGKFDKKTKKLLETPRCGVPDLVPDDGRRKKRYVLKGSKWEYTNLTWSLRIPPTLKTKYLDPRAVQRELKEALEIWAENSKLTFDMVNHDNADIVIEFSRGYHGDGFPFDGRGKILAHAFFPGRDRGGDAHFDDDEIWLMQRESNGVAEEVGTSLFAVAAHEFGHSLGLAHSSTVGALMYPWYQGSITQEGKYRLPDDDMYGIQQLYGAREERPYGTRRPYNPWTTPSTTTTTTTPPPRTHRPHHGDNTPSRPHYPPPTRAPPSEIPDTCNTNYDAISIIRGELFIFKAKYFWRIDRLGQNKVQPVLISRFFYDMPKDLTHVDAVYERKDQKIVFFIGNKYYLYDGNNLTPGYPKPLTHLGLPSTLDKIDGAMVWGHNSKTYLFSGTMYWRLDEMSKMVELDYPRDMRMWRGVDYNIDCVFKYYDGITYFFKGKGYWAFDDRKMRVRHKAQKLSAPKWMKCPVGEENDLRPSQEYELEERFGVSKALPCRTFSVMSILLSVVYHFLSSHIPL
ncbi:matrix metalloproteinase-2-like isoform X2 [Hetaerina americana]